MSPLKGWAEGWGGGGVGVGRDENHLSHIMFQISSRPLISHQTWLSLEIDPNHPIGGRVRMTLFLGHRGG